MLHAFVRALAPCRRALHHRPPSPVAETAPGVRLVLTAADVAHLGPTVPGLGAPQPDGSKHERAMRRSCATDSVRYVGDAVAFVVADTATQARDAAELIEVD